MGSRDVISFARQNFKKKADAQKVAEKLAEVAVRRHTADNVAVIVIDLGGGATGWAGAKPKQKGLLTRMFSK
jgi:serine/threonine protein phosphatase PrpC